jgi:hypothetical protein
MSNLLTKNLLIGSSNVYKLYKSGSNSRNYKMIKCTKSESFEAHISNLVQGNKFILVSTIENFVADKVTNTEQPDAKITQCLRSFLKSIEDAASKLPDSKFCIVMLTHRPLYA